MNNKKYVLINPKKQYFKEISKQNKIIFTNDVNESAKIDYNEIENLTSLIESYSRFIVISKQYNGVIPINQDSINRIAKDFNDKEVNNYKIIIHCPYCGKEIELIIDNIENETFEQEVNCKCKNNFKIEYDKVMGRMKILADMYMK